MKENVDVLIMDDDPDLCLLMETILKFNDYTIKSCSNANLFYQILETIEPNVIVMDMLLSGKDGRDICRDLKSRPAYNATKILMISAHPDADKTCREAGADGFLVKPFDIDEFTSKVASFVNEKA